MYVSSVGMIIPVHRNQQKPPINFEPGPRVGCDEHPSGPPSALQAGVCLEEVGFVRLGETNSLFALFF